MRGAPLLEHEAGTVRGYRWHRKFRNTPCLACTVAWAALQADMFRSGRCAKGLGWPLERSW